MLKFAKAHAYGNDFLYVRAADVSGATLDALARELCDRHTGVGADGLIVYEEAAGDVAQAAGGIACSPDPLDDDANRTNLARPGGAAAPRGLAGLRRGSRRRPARHGTGAYRPR